jgi:hypothetical protein
MNPNYNPNTPTPTLPYADWQSSFIQNFQQLYTAFSRNHIPLDALANAGNHTIIELTEKQIPQITSANEIAVYTKNVPGQTDQIFIRNQGNGQEYQYTTYQLYSLGNFLPGQANQFFTFLPGNIICIFGFSVAKTKQITLKPPIIKNIVTCSVVPIGNITQSALGVNFLAKGIAGIIDTMNLEVAPGFTLSGFGFVPNPSPIPATTYLVLGNI